MPLRRGLAAATLFVLVHAASAATPSLRDVAYGSDPAQRMDVYLPPDAKNAPVLLLVHGGAWRIGDKAHGRVVENKVARWVPQGFVVVSVNYRMLPGADPRVQADDVALALATAQRQAPAWGGDPAKFVLMGHSAGAHLVSLLDAQPARAQRRRRTPLARHGLARQRGLRRDAHHARRPPAPVRPRLRPRPGVLVRHVAGAAARARGTAAARGLLDEAARRLVRAGARLSPPRRRRWRCGSRCCRRR
jgi:acetyl esterase/lipase